MEDQPDAPLVRITAGGETVIAIRDPSAAEQVIRKQGFTPKWEIGYRLFMYMVRATLACAAPGDVTFGGAFGNVEHAMCHPAL